jgi:hypothetical protein
VIDWDFADPADFIGRDVVLVARQKTELEGSPFARYFKNVERLLPIMLERAGEPVSTLSTSLLVTLCKFPEKGRESVSYAEGVLSGD